MLPASCALVRKQCLFEIGSDTGPGIKHPLPGNITKLIFHVQDLQTGSYLKNLVAGITITNNMTTAKIDGIKDLQTYQSLMVFSLWTTGFWITKQKKVSIKRMVVIWSPVPVLFIFFGTIILLLAALSVFVWLATLSKDIRSFQFQILVFIIFWVVGGIAYILQNSGTIVASPLQGDIGLEINFVSFF
jgi:hypothetical protein